MKSKIIKDEEKVTTYQDLTKTSEHCEKTERNNKIHI